MAAKYLNGSTLNDTPYEVVYTLSRALRDWTSQPSVITTALDDYQDYHFHVLDPGQVIRTFVDSEFDTELIQIALPKLYRHRPIYNVALYHELGHFLDMRFRVVDLTLLLSSPSGDGLSITPEHRREHFSDLVAASYTGTSIIRLLEHISPDDPGTIDHPATPDRIALVDRFLSAKKDPLIELYQQALSLLRLPNLGIKFMRPDIDQQFDNLRPYEIQQEQELHGILEAGWDFLASAQRQTRSPWSDLNEFDVNRIVNDLIEKSIRNWMIKERWQNGVANQR